MRIMDTTFTFNHKIIQKLFFGCKRHQKKGKLTDMGFFWCLAFFHWYCVFICRHKRHMTSWNGQYIIHFTLSLPTPRYDHIWSRFWISSFDRPRSSQIQRKTKPSDDKWQDFWLALTVCHNNPNNFCVRLKPHLLKLYQLWSWLPDKWLKAISYSRLCLMDSMCNLPHSLFI